MPTSVIVSTSAVNSHTQPARISLSTEYTLNKYQISLRHLNETIYHANISSTLPLQCDVCYDLHIPRPSRLIPPQSPQNQPPNKPEQPTQPLAVNSNPIKYKICRTSHPTAEKPPHPQTGCMTGKKSGGLDPSNPGQLHPEVPIHP